MPADLRPVYHPDRQGQPKGADHDALQLFVVSTLGCASSGMPKPIGANDMSMLAGKWSGMLTLPTSTAVPGATSQTGGLSAVMGDSSASASLTERQGGTLVLTGYGKSDRGPFYFDVTKQK